MRHRVERLKNNLEEDVQYIGRVLWWSDRDENGIIVDHKGNEFYFDRSVLNLKKSQSIKRKSVVTFNINQSISDCLCACNIQIPAANKIKSFEKEYNKQASVAL